MSKLYFLICWYPQKFVLKIIGISLIIIHLCIILCNVHMYCILVCITAYPCQTAPFVSDLRPGRTFYFSGLQIVKKDKISRDGRGFSTEFQQHKLNPNSNNNLPYREESECIRYNQTFSVYSITTFDLSKSMLRCHRKR
jgi:hypothetical protein